MGPEEKSENEWGNTKLTGTVALLFVTIVMVFMFLKIMFD